MGIFRYHVPLGDQGFRGSILKRYRGSTRDGRGSRAGSVGEDLGILRVRLADLLEATFLFFFAWLSTETDPAPCGPPLACG